MTSVEQFDCSLCGGKTCKPVFSAFDFDQSNEPFEIKQCTSCGVAQTCPLPDPTSLAKYYSGSYYGSGARKFSGLIEYLTVLGSKFRAKTILKALSSTRVNEKKFKVLDIGCGRANLLKQLSQNGCDCYGIEHEEFPPNILIPSIKIHYGSIEEAEFENSSFDAVIIWHALEHLYQPAGTLDEMARITIKGGLAAIAVPNFSSLQSRWFKSNWFHLDLPRHLNHFSSDSLSQALTQRGYIIDSVGTCSLEQNLFGFIQSFMNCFRFFVKPNEFYQLLKQRSGIIQNLRLVVWILLSLLVLPFALAEFVISCIMKKGASTIIFAHKS